MGSKQQPGNFDCYANAKLDEEMFVLLARDPTAPHLVRAWAALRDGRVVDAQYEMEEAYEVLLNRGRLSALREKTNEARQCADRMILWKREHPEI